MYIQKHKFYSTGIFALVDSYHKDIWFVLSNNQQAIRIKNIFVSKISLLAVNLTAYKNFNINENTVDSEVCLNWQVAESGNYSLAVPTLLNPELYDDIITDYSQTPELINCPVTTNIDLNQKLELQDQMYLYSKIYKLFDQDWPTDIQHTVDQLFNSIEEIFFQEISLAIIEDRIYSITLIYMNELLQLCSQLIQILGRNLYE